MGPLRWKPVTHSKVREARTSISPIHWTCVHTALKRTARMSANTHARFALTVGAHTFTIRQVAQKSKDIFKPIMFILFAQLRSVAECYCLK